MQRSLEREEAIKQRGRTDLLTRSCQEAAHHPGVEPDGLVDLAEAVHDDANEARATSNTGDDQAIDVDGVAPSRELVAGVRSGLAELVGALMGGATLATYDAGSLRLLLRQLDDLLPDR